MMKRLITEFEIAYLSPIHHDYPAWPGGERWLQLYETAQGTQIVFTKGLSDGEENNYEVFLETDDLISPEDFGSSWQANLVYETGKVLPRVNNLGDRIKTNKFLTLQIDIDGAPEEWSLESPDGNIGLFLSIPTLDSSDFDFIPLNIKLMRPKELLYAVQNDNEGRKELAELYARQGKLKISNLERDSVI